MSAWLNAMNPAAPIGNEAEAQRAARSSAVSIFIGVAVAAVSSAWSFMNMDKITAAASAAAAQSGAAEGAVQAGAQVGLWLGVGLGVIQLIFALVQWRDPKKFIAILFLVLIALGIVSTLAAPLMAGMAATTGAPVTPMWQIVLSFVILVVQAVLHVAGLRGIKRLDEMQMAAAR